MFRDSYFVESKVDSTGKVASNFYQNKVSIDTLTDNSKEVGQVGVAVNNILKEIFAEQTEVNFDNNAIKKNEFKPNNMESETQDKTIGTQPHNFQTLIESLNSSMTQKSAEVPDMPSNSDTTTEGIFAESILNTTDAFLSDVNVAKNKLANTSFSLNHTTEVHVGGFLATTPTPSRNDQPHSSENADTLSEKVNLDITRIPGENKVKETIESNTLKIEFEYLNITGLTNFPESVPETTNTPVVNAIETGNTDIGHVEESTTINLAAVNSDQKNSEDDFNNILTDNSMVDSSGKDPATVKKTATDISDKSEKDHTWITVTTFNQESTTNTVVEVSSDNIESIDSTVLPDILGLGIIRQDQNSPGVFIPNQGHNASTVNGNTVEENNHSLNLPQNTLDDVLENASYPTILNERFASTSKVEPASLPSSTLVEEDELEDSSQENTSSVRNNVQMVLATESTVKGTSNISEIVIDTLAKLFFKTLDLSIKIQGAIVSNNRIGGKKKEFQIKSKVDSQEIDAGKDNLPTLIKITADDAIEIENIENDKSSVENVEHTEPVVIIYRESGNTFVNISDDMVIELDLSNLPSELIERENVIRERVRNLVQSIFLESQAEEESIASNLSDEIIKNITKIVLSQMEESLTSGHNGTVLTNFVESVSRQENRSETTEPFQNTGIWLKKMENTEVPRTSVPSTILNSATDLSASFLTTHPFPGKYNFINV